MEVNPEADRPKNMTEMITGDTSWKELGIRIKWTEPETPGELKVKIGEPIRIRVAVEVKKDVSLAGDEVAAYCWTNLIYEGNPQGVWKDIKLLENTNCRAEDGDIVTYTFNGTLAPVSQEDHMMTFNVKWKKFLVWANDFKRDSFCFVEESALPEMEIDAPVNFSCGKEVPPGDTRRVKVPAPAPMPTGPGAAAAAGQGDQARRGSEAGVVDDETIEVRIQALDFSDSSESSLADGNSPVESQTALVRESMRTTIPKGHL